ncbi:MAG: hypothetical protein D6706_16645 [Chloroflexi bacterium]|nr:MAG: hypothetical protein D6706_16645 [Chloroflexota bacterium]
MTNLIEVALPSGKTVHIRPVSAALVAQRLRRRYPAPKPPLQTVDYGNGIKRKEFNYSHPDYLKAREAWERFLQELTGDAILQEALNIPLSAKQKKEIEKWRRENPELAGELSDHDIYWYYLTLTSDADMMAIIEAAQTLTMSDIEAAEDSFRRNVQGETTQ